MTAGTVGRVAGYLSTWTARPGELVGVHAALLVDRLPAERTTASVTVDVVTLDGPDLPAPPDVRPRARTLTEAVPPTGSYLRTGPWTQTGDDVSLMMWLRAENTVHGRRQTLAELVRHDDAVKESDDPAEETLPVRTWWYVDADGNIVVDHAGHRTETGIPLDPGIWYLMTFIRTAHRADLLWTDGTGTTLRARSDGDGTTPRERGECAPAAPVTRWHATIGARTASGVPSDTLNARIEDLVVVARELRQDEAERAARGERGIDNRYAADPSTVAVWDFVAIGVAGRPAATRADIPAATPANPPRTPPRLAAPRLSIVNNPTDGLRGHGGRRGAALHLSSDDLDDARWPLIAEVRVGARQRSGVLGVRVTTANGRLDLPLIVGPSSERPRTSRAVPGSRPPRALLLLPTFTYLAYANHRQRSERAFFGDYRAVSDRPIVLDEVNAHLNDAERLGASLYDRRADGTPAVYSSRLRPILSIDPDYRWWLTGTYRHYPADLRFLRWLRSTGHPVDVTSDEHLHDEGADLLSGYRVLITGSHPEYVSEEVHDAVTAFTRTGGRLMYLGGNGFYWVAARTADAPHRIEVRRRGDGGWWSAPDDEATMTANGRPGGLWSLCGRPPQDLLGVAYAAQGWPRASGYRRLPDADHPDFAFVFAGVPGEVVGESGHALDGAAGDEIDSFRPDPRHPGTARLATSAGRHPPLFLEAADSKEAGTPGAVRADMVLRRLPGGGAVFSVGSVTWTASVTWNHGDNDVATITRNVLDRFLHDPVPRPAPPPDAHRAPEGRP
ncbi:N,N-dimethylformamidase beta subunit family domain-containing protein [Actinomadura decatromicini]|uniref:N,N-dimethylformamidase beta subunit family domain-containing protein n=1 Tax=Actinomadura decatromicini TaxID=2604572 RepID=UPI00165313A8|nr:N,N-dimethylformamidase beta subunit family domain-containing protein [Actinomadura decatromicini]